MYTYWCVWVPIVSIRYTHCFSRSKQEADHEICFELSGHCNETISSSSSTTTTSSSSTSSSSPCHHVTMSSSTTTTPSASPSPSPPSSSTSSPPSPSSSANYSVSASPPESVMIRSHHRWRSRPLTILDALRRFELPLGEVVRIDLVGSRTRRFGTTVDMGISP